MKAKLLQAVLNIIQRNMKTNSVCNEIFQLIHNYYLGNTLTKAYFRLLNALQNTMCNSPQVLLL